MNKIIEASELPNGEKVYLKKSWLGWRVVEPWKDMETEKINWINFLGLNKSNLIFLAFITILAIGFYLGVNELINSYKFIADNPCKFCEDCFAARNTIIGNWSFKK